MTRLRHVACTRAASPIVHSDFATLTVDVHTRFNSLGARVSRGSVLCCPACLPNLPQSTSPTPRSHLLFKRDHRNLIIAHLHVLSTWQTGYISQVRNSIAAFSNCAMTTMTSHRCRRSHYDHPSTWPVATTEPVTQTHTRTQLDRLTVTRELQTHVTNNSIV